MPEQTPLLSRPWVQSFKKYASGALAAIGAMNAFHDFPGTLRTYKTFLPIVGHILWLFIKWPLEYVALVILAFYGLNVGGKMVIFVVLTRKFWVPEDKNRIKKWEEHWEPFAFVLAFPCAIWLAYAYGFKATFGGIWEFLRTAWKGGTCLLYTSGTSMRTLSQIRLISTD